MVAVEGNLGRAGQTDGTTGPALLRAGSYAAAKEQGLTRLEGKDYIMQEGDVVNFRFNV